jgi:Uma2 family endonuclease
MGDQTSCGHYERQGNSLVLTPKPTQRHMVVVGELFAQLRHQLPADLRAVIGVEAHLESISTRTLDLVVMPRNRLHPTDLANPADIRLVVNVISPYSVRTDTKYKPIEYADAGIEHFWLIDPEPPVTATIYRLIGPDYEESQRAEHTFTVTEPCSLTIDLDALLD